MRVHTRALGAVLVSGLLVTGLAGTAANADNTTISYDTLRTGWDSNESNLSSSAVSSSDFGRLFSTAVNGQVYAQPIVANGTLIVATENDYIYGMDPTTGAVRWQKSVGTPWPAAQVSCGDLTPNIGITGTPVYDPATNDVYFAAKVNDGVDAAHPHWYLHALDVTTGAERAGFPTTIQGAPTNNPTVGFNPETQMQRPGLLLLNGVVYAGFGSHCDATPYTGYVVGVNDSTGAQTTMWSTEASASNEAGIWQGGGGLVSDGAGRIILATGNGVAPAPGSGDNPPATLGESVVRLAVNPDGSLAAQSFFSPYNNINLNQNDADLGSGGPMAIPANFGTTSHPHLVVQVGKDGRVYLLDADHLGGAAQGPNGTDNAVGMAGPFNGVWGHPAFWGGNGGYVYIDEANGPLRALKYSTGGGTPSLTSVGTSAGTFGYTSGSPVVTSSGTTSGSALVWVEYASGANGAGAQLRAYNPIPQNGVLQQVYAAPIGTAAKFAVPGTDGNRVYVGTRDGHVLAFGQPTKSPLTTQPYDFGSTAVNGTGTGNVTVTATENVTVSSVSAPAPFVATALSSPVSLTQGQTITVPVSYTPTNWGSATANLSFATDHGTVALSLTGYGTQPGLGASPGSLDFGTVHTGASSQLGVNVVNTGTTSLTVTGASGPSTAPYTANLPATGTTMAPGATQVVAVTFTPTTGTDAGITDPDSFEVDATDGTNNYRLTVPITGTAVTGQPIMTLSPTTVDFGIVPVGTSVTKSFTVTNTGTAALSIEKAKAPAGAFTADQIEGQQNIQPGDSVQVNVTFTPTSAYPATAQYEITGSDNASAQYVTLTGNVDPIGAYYQQLGGSKSYLGDPLAGEYATANGGMAEDFRYGSIYWSPATGAHAVHGMILAHYKAMGGPASALGYPTTDEQGTPDGIGRYNHFTGQDAFGGSIYWTPNTGAHEVYGAIRAKWSASGWERGPMGYPTTDEQGTPDGIGRFNHFTGHTQFGASIYWTPNTGAHEVYGAIRAKWSASGWERGPMGYPTTDEQGTPDGIGRYNHFTGQNGSGASIYWSPGTGPHLIYGAIRAKWASLGWERGRLGYPTSDEYGVTGGRRNTFQHGSITFHFSTGAVQVTYY